MRRVGNNSAFIVLVVMASLFTPLASHAQDAPTLNDQKWAERYRNDIANSWHWKPGRGVGLTTTEYALDYVERYVGTGVSGYLSKPIDGLVLFQTETHDIIILTWGSHEMFKVVHRRTGEVVGGTHFSSRYKDRIRSVDVDGVSTLELQHERLGASGTGQMFRSFNIYDLTDGFETMLAVEGIFDDHRCPMVQERFKDPASGDSLSQNDISQTPSLRRFRMFGQLAVRGSHGDCRFAAEQPQFRRTCRFAFKGRCFSCRDEILKTAQLDIEDLETGGDDAASNYEWFLANEEKLRQLGFRFEDDLAVEVSKRLAKLREAGRE